MVSGKLTSRPLLKACTAATAAGSKSSTISFRDKLTNKFFLIDSGAEVSLTIPTAADKAKGYNQSPLTAINGSKVNIYGTKTMNIQFAGHIFKWKFVIADTNSNLIGADFLREQSLIVNLQFDKKFHYSLPDFNRKPDCFPC